MHSLSSRASQILSAWVMSFAAIACFLAALSFFPQPLPAVSLKVTDVRLHHYQTFRDIPEKNDVAVLTFDLSVDLRDLFDWNTKEIFLFLVAEYATQRNAFNQITVWDKVIWHANKKDHALNLKNEKAEYLFMDDGAHLKGHPNVTLSVHWDTVPFSGILPIRSTGPIASFAFKDVYDPIPRG